MLCCFKQNITMENIDLFSILFLFSLTESLILPVLFSAKSDTCDQQTIFKDIKCVNNGFIVYTAVTFGPSNNPQLRHVVRLQLDTGSYVTWLATDNTQLKDVTVRKLIYLFVLIS